MFTINDINKLKDADSKQIEEIRKIIAEKYGKFIVETASNNIPTCNISLKYRDELYYKFSYLSLINNDLLDHSKVKTFIEKYNKVFESNPSSFGQILQIELLRVMTDDGDQYHDASYENVISITFNTRC